MTNQEDEFDPKVDYKVIEPDISGKDVLQWARHGGTTAGTIVATRRPFPKPEWPYDYEGGIAKKATLYVATSRATDETANTVGTVINIKNLFTGQNAGTQPEYNLDRYAGAIERVLKEKPLAINLSINIDADYKTEAEVDAKYKGNIEKFESGKFISAVKNAVKQDTLMVFATGNESNPQPGVFALLPRYFEGLERHIVAVTALPLEIDPQQFPQAEFANKCSVAKAWCITAPGAFLTPVLRGAETNEKISRTTEDIGTSIAAPVVTGSLGILKQRFNYFKPPQVRDTLFTTATDIGDSGIDDVYGWGLVNIEKALKGPMQLLANEDYEVNSDDSWDNPLNAHHYTFTKTGERSLTLNGTVQLANVIIKNGQLIVNGRTQANKIENNARFTLNTALNTPISGATNSITTLGEKGHWTVPASTSVGSIVMEKGSQITLSPVDQNGQSYAGGEALNTLTISHNLSGNGIFNFVTHTPDSMGYKVLVNGVASGNFSLNVKNSGKEPSSNNRLTLVHLQNSTQDPSAVKITLEKNVDLGAYRYELIREGNNLYRLYNPRKEQERQAGQAEVA